MKLQNHTVNLLRLLCTLTLTILLSVMVEGEGHARLTEPDVVYFGTVTGGSSGDLLTLKLDADGSTLKTATVAAKGSYLLRVPMDSVEPRVGGTARSGDKTTFYLGSKILHVVVIPDAGTLSELLLSATTPTKEEWLKLHPGDDGSGDKNRNGISDLQDYLNGDDPYHLWNILTVSTLADGSIVTDPTLNVAGTVTDNGSGIGVKGVTVNGQGATFTNGSFSTGVTLVEGANVITVIAFDNADHKTMDSRTVILDRTAPVLVVTQPVDNSVTGKAFMAVTGNVGESTATVSAKVNNGLATSATMNGIFFTVTLNLIPGLNTIDITAKDQAGNSSNAKRTVLSDTAAPSLAVTDPPQDMTTTQGSVVVSGKVTDAVSGVTITLSVDAQSLTPVVAANGTFSQVVTLTTDKSYAVMVTATDEAGNKTTVQRNIIKSSAVVETPAAMLADAVKACQYLYGQTVVTDAEKLRLDCAPLGTNGKPNPNGVVDLGDVILLLRRSIGLVSW